MPDADVGHVAADDARNPMEGISRSMTELDMETATSEDEDYESAPPKYNIVTYPADFTLEVLHLKWKTDEIHIPSFQRRFVWKQTQASKLIESFLLGLPVPAVFLYAERESRKYLVIDGQQRLRSVFDYFDGGFRSDKRKFKLIRLDESSPFHERTFDDLLEEDQRRLKNSVLRAFIVEQIEPLEIPSCFLSSLYFNELILLCFYISRSDDCIPEHLKVAHQEKVNVVSTRLTIHPICKEFLLRSSSRSAPS